MTTGQRAERGTAPGARAGADEPAEGPARDRSAWNAFREGAVDSAPILVAAAPVGLLFGTLAGQLGLSPLDAALMSATVYAGASQMVAVDLFGREVPMWAIVVSVFAVNFRHVLYSAALAPVLREFAPTKRAAAFFLLIDPQFALTESRRERGRPVPFAWYLGLALPIYVLWVLEGWVGAAFGARIGNTAALGLDMILPIYFLALVMGFRSRPRWVATVAASATVSLLAFHAPMIGSPWHVSLGALAGVATAALMPPRR